MKGKRMTRSQSAISASAALAIAVGANAQILNGSTLFSQPWPGQLGSLPSVSEGFCDGLTTFAPVLIDDFTVPLGGRVTRVVWWGTNPTEPDTPNEWFSITFAPNPSGSCNYLDFEFTAGTCGQAKAVQVGIDCVGLPVYRFELATTFEIAPGTRHFLIISEIDQGPEFPDSPNVDEVDFAWSGYRPFGLFEQIDCQAQSRGPAPGGFSSPLLGPCDAQPVDLAFQLHRNLIRAQLVPNDILTCKYLFEILAPGTATPIDAQEATVFPDGTAHVSFDVPEGAYELRVSGPDIEPIVFADIAIGPGAEVDLGAIPRRPPSDTTEPWIFGNPYDPNLGSNGLTPSVVNTCDQFAQPADTVHRDDFGARPTDSAINRVRWWGINPHQDAVPVQHFLIRVFEDDLCSTVGPSFLSVCVQPHAKAVGIDCNGATVLQYDAQLPAPIVAPSAAGTRWIEIAEIDDQSLVPGIAEFAWSPARRLSGCNAFSASMGGDQLAAVSFCPSRPGGGLDVPVDLAFALYTSVFTGQIGGLSGQIAPMRATLRDSSSDQIVEVRSFDLASDGSFMVSFDAPDGTYDLLIEGGPSVGALIPTVSLISGEATELGSILYPVGDADFSGQVNFGDITAVLGNWLATGPQP